MAKTKRNVQRKVTQLLSSFFPQGARVVLTRIQNDQIPPFGPQGTVTGINDNGTIKVSWDKLTVCEDSCAETELPNNPQTPIMKKIVAYFKKRYPKGTRVELMEMEDVQAPPVGTQGTVTGVDESGTIMVDWDNGSHLGLVFGKSHCRLLEKRNANKK